MKRMVLLFGCLNRGALLSQAALMMFVGAIMVMSAASTACAEEILPGETKTGSLAEGEIDIYTFQANADDFATILMGEISGETWFEPQVELHAPDGTVVDVNSGGASATIESVKLPQDGTYFIIARDKEGWHIGEYGLSLVKNPGTIMVADPNGGPIAPGEYKTGSLTEGDLDPYTFWANAGDSVTILIGEVSGETWFEPQVELHAPDGTVVETASGGASATIESAKLSQDGTYFIIARDKQGYNTGEYGLSLSRTHVSGTPTLASLSDAPDPLTQGYPLTLTASGAADPDGFIARVDFYRDLNKNGWLDLGGTDQHLGSGTQVGDLWVWTGSITGFPLAGLNYYFARAIDNSGAGSDPVSCTGIITPLSDGDFNGDGQINCDDFWIFAKHWLSGDCGDPDWCDGTDLDRNGRVDSLDFELWMAILQDSTVPQP